MTLLQTYQYYDRYWNDTLGLKLFVRRLPTSPSRAVPLTKVRPKVALLLWVPSRRSIPEQTPLTIIEVSWT